jgi:hypothetical protein
MGSPTVYNLPRMFPPAPPKRVKESRVIGLSVGWDFGEGVRGRVRHVFDFGGGHILFCEVFL